MTQKGSHTQPPTMTTVASQLTTAQQLIYSRTRIVNSTSRISPELYGSLEPRDILSISLQGDKVQCLLADGEIQVDCSTVVSNFWEHRTRTPSFFDYKIWRQVENPKGCRGVAVGAIDYSTSPNRIAVDRDGVRKLYFVNEEEKTCTCGSWHQLNDCSHELKVEFEKYSNCAFEPVCKHLKWAEANTKLQALRYLAKDINSEYNPRMCVYTFDYRRGLLLYRVTYDGLKTKGQWFPVEGWKEKQVYGEGGIPSGECWDTFFSALSQAEPFKVIQFSHSVAGLMNSTRSKN
jgi:hypothetical protein